MNTRTSTRLRTAPKRLSDEVFLPGANNKFTVGRVVDAGKDVRVDSDEHHVGDFHKVDPDFIVSDDAIEEDHEHCDEEEEELAEDTDEEESEGEGWEDEHSDSCDESEEDEHSAEDESDEE